MFTAEILQAYEKDEFKPYIQAIVSAKDRKVYGGELLMRWLSSNRGMVYPVDFINTLEYSGLLPSVTEKMMRHIVHHFSEKKIYNFHLAVNITPKFLACQKFVEFCLNFARVNDVKVILELTEKQQFHIDKPTERSFIKLTDAGVEFALDDFGVGCSVLSYLKHIPVRYIKIDKLFTMDFVSNKTSFYIIESIIDLAKKMNIKTVAEGVQTQEQANTLILLGVDYLQGYYFGRPRKIADLLQEEQNELFCDCFT